MTRAGQAGGMVFGVLLGIGSVLLWTLRGRENATINVAGVEATGDSALGMLLTTVGAALLALAAVVILVATPILAKRPGGVVVGTPTRLLRTWPFGVVAEPWSRFRDASVDREGSVQLVRHVPSRGLGAPDDIVQPPDAQAIVALIRERVGALHEAAVTARSALVDYAFETTHTPGADLAPRMRLTAAGSAVIGLVVAVVFVSTLLQGGTITVSSNGGPLEEIGPDDPVAWVPVGVAFLFTAGGVAVLVLGRPRERPVRYIATSEALVIRRAEGEEESIPWSEFDGAIERHDHRGRADLHLPLRRVRHVRAKRGISTEQVVLRIIGVPKVDEVQSAFAQRLAPANVS